MSNTLSTTTGTRIEHWEKEIPKRLNNFIERKDYDYHAGKRGRALATKLTKEAISNLGIELGYSVSASGNPDQWDREWLYDMVWYRYDNNRLMTDVALVLESEMQEGWEHIKYDYEKLLVANVPLRVMICCCSNHSNEERTYRERDQIVRQCQLALDAYLHLPAGARVLLIIWEHHHTGRFQSFALAKGKPLVEPIKSALGE